MVAQKRSPALLIFSILPYYCLGNSKKRGPGEILRQMLGCSNITLLFLSSFAAGRGRTATTVGLRGSLALLIHVQLCWGCPIKVDVCRSK